MELSVAPSNPLQVVETRPVRAATSRDIPVAREELAYYYRVCQSFNGSDLTQVFLDLAGMLARAAEMRSLFMDDDSARSRAFCTRQIDPFIETIRELFKIFSRTQSVAQFELDTSR